MKNLFTLLFIVSYITVGQAQQSRCYEVDPSYNEYYYDGDGDGYGLKNNYICAATRPNGYALVYGDCDDTNANYHVATTFYRDLDGDGYGSAASGTQLTCIPSAGYVVSSNDCNDNDSSIKPGANEICGDGIDNDCDGQIDESLPPAKPTLGSMVNFCGETILSMPKLPGVIPGNETWYWQSTAQGEDFSTAAQAVSKSFLVAGNYYLRARNNNSMCWSDALEIVFTVNTIPTIPTIATAMENVVRCGEGDVTLVASYGANADKVHWFSSITSLTVLSDVASFTTNITQTTTDYYAASYNSSTACYSSERIRIRVTMAPLVTYYLDADNDGYAISTIQNCTSPGAGYTLTVLPIGDCDDTNTNVNSVAIWYLDADADGYAISSTSNCGSPGAGYTLTVLPIGDCDDTNTNVNSVAIWYLDADADGYAISSISNCGSPGAGYTQNILPITDCNDSNSSVHQETTWYADTDNDGLGDANISQQSCDQPIGYVANIGDCDDTNTNVNSVAIWYLDADADGYAISSTSNCGSPGVGYTQNTLPITDCNDSNSDVHQETTWYADNIDNDGLGDPSISQQSCEQPIGYVANNTDQCPTISSATNSCTVVPDSSDPADHNYVYTRTYQVGRTVADPVLFKQDDGVLQQVSYFDGLGRPVQQIAIDQSPNKNDIITPFVYDLYGRQEKEYLPYAAADINPGHFKPTAVSDLEGFYNTASYEYTTNPYSQKDLETSPLSRVMQQAAPGNDWALGSGHEIKFSYQTNTHNIANVTDPTKDNVRMFTILLTNDFVPSLGVISYYEQGELYKTITKDENHDGSSSKLHTTEEFTDKQGKVILKRTYADIDLNSDGDLNDVGDIAQARHDTYYVYDDYGNLTYVLPPKMEASTAGLATLITNLPELGYRYTYDHRNRLIEKKIPGKGKEYIIYNTLDQPILTQNANQREGNGVDEWLFIKYDAFGRVTYTGKANYPNATTRESIQTIVSALSTNLWETKILENNTPSTIMEVSVFYSNTAYPIAEISEVLTINYYDTHDFDTENLIVPTQQIENQPWATSLKGLPTGSKIRVLGTDHFITTITHYDAKGRAIYGATDNPFLETVDIVETKLDFVGKALKTRSFHTRNSTTIGTLDLFTYDHVGRLKSQSQCLGDETIAWECGGAANVPVNLEYLTNANIPSIVKVSGSILLKSGVHLIGTGNQSYSFKIVSGANTTPEELITLNNYDELGQLENKKVGGAVDATEIKLSAGLQTVDYTYNVRGWLKAINQDVHEDNDLFNFSLNYNTPTLSGATALFNGNISETHWKTANDNLARNYYYKYDPLNRITTATDNTGKFNLSGITYDKNGNIKSLTRNGWQDNGGSSYLNMDVLTYDYGTENANKLYKVRDDGNDNHGFKDGTNTNDDFVYDGNGNMITDANKGIIGITYNHLNMPTRITVTGSNAGTVDYVYAADRTKLRKKKNTRRCYYYD